MANTVQMVQFTVDYSAAVIRANIRNEGASHHVHNTYESEINPGTPCEMNLYLKAVE